MVAIIVRATGLGDAEALDGNTPLVGAGISLDSVGVLELLVGLEKEFEVELTPAELTSADALRTIGTLVTFIDSKVNPS